MIVVANSPIFGRNLKFLRESKNLSLADMATLIHMESDALEQLEQGLEYDIDYDSLRIVYDFFDGDMDHLFDQLFEER